MTASITDTGDLPAEPHAGRVGPIGDVRGAGAPRARAAIRRERRQLRRQRQLYALGGILVLTAFFGATLVVLDVVR